MLEVEVKARVSSLGSVRSLLGAIGAVYTDTEHHIDVYYSHPCRDFASTDEALRTRKIGDKLYLTYKGPKVDPDSKTRRELELPVEEGIVDVLRELGFREAGRVVKAREKYTLDGLKVCLDDVEGLGSFIELESRNLEDKNRMFKLLEKLEVKKTDCIRESYLELLQGIH